MCVSFSRRGQPIATLLDDVDRELDVERRLESGADDFALALPRMSVAHEEQRASNVDRQHHFDAGIEAGVVHVAAERAGRRGRDRLTASGSDADAAEHRPQG